MIQLKQPAVAILTAVCLALVSGCVGGAAYLEPESQLDAETEASLLEIPEIPTTQERVRPEDYEIDARLPEILREAVLENRQRVFQPFDHFVVERARQLLTGGLDPEMDHQVARIVAEGNLTEEALQNLKQLVSPELTRQEAEEEVYFLFDYLKYGYCGYQYLGGDDTFLPIRHQMLQKVAAMSEPIDITDYKYEILIPGLEQAIRDSHFTLDSYRFTAYYEKPWFLYNEELAFQKTPEGFEAQVDGRAVLLRTVDGEAPADWVVPWLDREGAVTWVVATSSSEQTVLAVTLSLEDRDTGETLTRRLTLSPADHSYRDGFDPAQMGYALEEMEGIPVMINRRLYTLDGESLSQDDPQLKAMVEEADTLSGEPVLIIDLRGNPGGNDGYCFDWMQGYAGTEFIPRYSAVSTSLLTETVYSSADWIVQFFGDQFERVENNDPPYWREIVGNPARKVANDSLVFVLMDNAVASSGESFVAALREMDNVVLVGTNTAGCGTMGNIRSVVLPNSGMVLSCGMTLFLQPDLSFFEGIGHQPDIWTPPGEALERTVRFIQAQNLKEK